MNTKELIEAVTALQTKVEELETKMSNIQVRDRGPKSERTMTRNDAWRVKFGDLKTKSHKEAAAELGLSYGQVYSARGDYTFKDVKAEEFGADQAEADQTVAA